MQNLETFISICLSGLTFFLGQQKGIKKEGEKQGIVLNELKILNQEITELKTDIKDMQPTVIKLKSDLKHCQDDLRMLKR